jgi:hypothetical protein
MIRLLESMIVSATATSIGSMLKWLRDNLSPTPRLSDPSVRIRAWNQESTATVMSSTMGRRLLLVNASMRDASTTLRVVAIAGPIPVDNVRP